MTPAQREEQIEFIINVYKDTHGVKPRHIDFHGLSDVELDQMADTVVEDSQALSDADDAQAAWEERAHMEVMTEIRGGKQ